jgi:hypothetical protein
MTARRLTVSSLAGASLSLALAAAVLVTAVPARAADDDVPLDSKILRGLMESLGLRKDGEGINYQERAPLVVPPSRALPPPERSDAVIANNPAWPKDPDVQRAKDEAAAERNESRWASDKIIKQDSVLRGNDLTPGPKPRGGSRTASTGPNWSSDDPRLSPSELGYKGGFFSKIFGGKEEETARFTGEPPRASLTEPPAGYRTPSPDQPYGLGARSTAPKAVDYMTTHGEGSK